MQAGVPSVPVTEPEPDDAITPVDEDAVVTGTVLSVGSGKAKQRFRVLDAENRTVTFLGGTKNATRVKVPAAITINEVRYKVTTVEKRSLYGQKRAKKVSVGKNVTTVGRRSFAKMRQFREADLSKARVRVMGTHLFTGDRRLKTVRINGNGLRKVKKGAFAGITKKTTIKVYAKSKSLYRKVIKKLKRAGGKRAKYRFVKRKR